jgi:hypothetical protein
MHLAISVASNFELFPDSFSSHDPSVPFDFTDPAIRLALNSGLRQFELWPAQNWIEVPKWNDKNAGHVANCQLWNIDWPT